MSVSATVSTLGQMLDNSARLRDIRTQLSTLQTQLSTQKKAQDMSGLGGNGTRAVRARIDLNQISVFQSNIAIGTAQLDSTSNTLNEFVQQSKNIADTLAGKTQKGNVDITDVRASVQHTFDYLRELLNTQSDGKYIMAGSDSYNAPLNDAGPHNTYMAKLVEDWRTGVIDTDTLITNYQATPETTMGYSASLSSNQVKNVYVRADVNHDVDITLAADSDGFKKILNGLALINNMNIDKVATDPNDPPGTTTAPGVDAAQQKDNINNGRLPICTFYQTPARTQSTDPAKLNRQ